MTYRIRPAERRDLAALNTLATAQASMRKALDPRLPASPQVVPFLSAAHSLGDVLAWRHHATFVAEQDGIPFGGINIYQLEQCESDQFATYYPRPFTSIGLLATHERAPADTLADLIASAQAQANRWRTPFLLTQNASADRTMHDALQALRFRTYYHYALKTPSPDSKGMTGAGVEGLIVRPALTGDLDAVVRLGMESVRYHSSLEPTMQAARDEPSKMHERLEQAIRDGEQSSVLVGERDGHVIGFYSIYVQQIDDTWTPPLFASGRYGLIAEVAVHPSLRGLGIGRQMFAAAKQWFSVRAVEGIWLIYLPHNPLSSRFWSALDFAPVWEVVLRDQ